MRRNEIFTTTTVENTVKPLTQEQIDSLAASFLPLIQEYYKKEQNITLSQNTDEEAA